MGVMKSTGGHQRTRRGCHFSLHFRMCMVTACYCGKMIHAILYSNKDFARKYEDVGACVSAEKLCIKAVNKSNEVESSEGKRTHAWIVYALLNMLHLVHDPQCLQGIHLWRMCKAQTENRIM